MNAPIYSYSEQNIDWLTGGLTVQALLRSSQSAVVFLGKRLSAVLVTVNECLMLVRMAVCVAVSVLLCLKSL